MIITYVKLGSSENDLGKDVTHWLDLGGKMIEHDTVQLYGFKVSSMMYFFPFNLIIDI